MSERNPQDRGALWGPKTGGKGSYFTGTLQFTPSEIEELRAAGGKLKVFVPQNDRKKLDAEPDYRILKSTPKADTRTTGGNAEAQFARGPVTDDEIEPF